jgi:hypothetical protein
LNPENTKQSLTFGETELMMDYRRMPIEVESPEPIGYETIPNKLSESSYTNTVFRDIRLNTDLGDLPPALLDAFWEGSDLSQALGNDIKVCPIGIYINTLIICQGIAGCTVYSPRRRRDGNGIGSRDDTEQGLI